MKSHTLQAEDEPVFALITGPALRWNDVLHLSHKTTIIIKKTGMSFPAFTVGNTVYSHFSEPQAYVKKHCVPFITVYKPRLSSQ